MNDSHFLGFLLLLFWTHSTPKTLETSGLCAGVPKGCHYRSMQHSGTFSLPLKLPQLTHVNDSLTHTSALEIYVSWSLQYSCLLSEQVYSWIWTYSLVFRFNVTNYPMQTLLVALKKKSLIFFFDKAIGANYRSWQDLLDTLFEIFLKMCY